MNPSYPYPGEQALQALLAENGPLPEKIRHPLFGALSLLEEGYCPPGESFSGRIPKDQEVITLMLGGTLVHKNTTGTLEILPEGGIQLVSAGDGIRFSKFNPSGKQTARYLRIGLHAPAQSRLRRYEQLTGPGLYESNQLTLVARPWRGPLSLTLDLQAWLWFGLYDTQQVLHYSLQKEGNGVYGYVIEGQIQVDDQWLQSGDHFAVADSPEVMLETKGNTRFVLIEVPL